jgi:release factor glutamine methyltransferase
MKQLIRNIITHTYKPLLKKYLAKERIYKHNGLQLRIHPDVFHPGFFFSTKLLLSQLDTIPMKGKSLLEIGAGSGLIAMSAAKSKAIVTATDINPVAVEYLYRNSKANSTTINILQADVFEDVPPAAFDIIAINPPYYKKNPQNDAEHAWYCGENGEYFKKLFSNLARYIHRESQVLMVLCDGCDIEMIAAYGRKNHFSMTCIHTKKNLVETNYIYSIAAAV